MKVDLNCAFVRGGDLSVMKDGQLRMLKWCVLNSDSVQKVSLVHDPIIPCLHIRTITHVCYASGMLHCHA